MWSWTVDLIIDCRYLYRGVVLFLCYDWLLHLFDLQAARNCLVGENNNVKVADYSLALYTSSRKPSRTVVSVRWAAPELIVQQPMFTTKSDVWSFGKYQYGWVSRRLQYAGKTLTSWCSCHIASILHQRSHAFIHPLLWPYDVIMVGFYPGVVMWELWSGAQTPYLDLRNQEVKGKVNATCGIHI